MLPNESDIKPPGQKLVSKLSARTKWLVLAPVGLVLIGYGLCVFSEAGNLKHTGSPTIEWVLLGTYSLILINGGLSLFGQAVYFRVMMDVRRETRRSLRKLETKLASRERNKRSRDRKRKSSTKSN
ncbi:hypothetical protein [Persicitalea jodogahamensis]|uniref:Uncharacterized protein n=1 Tax=Persicitalea jodogahamensis TaxID=402147 RepID=A0A8J3DBY6_9BACT|nr:hypothetical protein [Persicitalea jodogahamensis]GHB81005.1 hypothetical protein GCM10007390_39600 [Persicitalea jodogahamensis]